MNSGKSVLLGLAVLLVSLLVFSAGTSGTFQIGIEQTVVPNIPLTSTVSALVEGNNALSTLLAMPTPTTAVTTPSPGTRSPTVPTLTPTPTRPSARFSNLRFSAQPEILDARRFYTAGTPRIYAVWDYENMRDGMLIRREWWRNGEIWIVKEENWDGAELGADGTIDAVIFDEATGLSAGEYHLTLYINGVRQSFIDDETGEEVNTFWLFPHSVQRPVTSPDRTYTAFVRQGGRLTIEYPDGDLRDLVVTQEVSGIEWFPDGLHILYEERDRSKQVNEVEDWGISHKLWVLNVETGDRHLIGTAGENIHSPVVSPTGKYVAALTGNTRREGCNASPNLVILELDSELRRQAVYVLADFSGLPFPNTTNMQAYPQERHSPGQWEDNDRLSIPLAWTCLDPDDNPQGIYLLDLLSKKAFRTGEL